MNQQQIKLQRPPKPPSYHDLIHGKPYNPEYSIMDSVCIALGTFFHILMWVYLLGY